LFPEYFDSVDKKLIDFVENLNFNQIGKNIKINGRDDLSRIESSDLVIFCISDYRLDTTNSKSFNADKDFRKKFYSLFYSDWNINFFDLGNLVKGNLVSDTQFALKSIIDFFIKNQIFVITIGGSQDFTLDLYSSLKKYLSKINLVAVNNKLEFSNENKESYLSKIIMDENNKLNHFSNIGFQKHLNSLDEIDLIKKMKFESLSLGKVKSDLNEAEPILRDSNLISFNIKSIKSGDINNAHQYPNGLTSYEFCSLSRFSGASLKSNVISYFENWDFSILNSLLAESVWYVIDGFSARIDETPDSDNDNFTYYFIEIDNYKFKFYHSLLSDRWWVEFINDNIVSVEKNIISCTYNDYFNCKNSIISERILTRLKNKIT
tara:strand:- start:4203 stop:5333 length:1131 start_codon:yes stop_codon:yes gene_type:complete